MAHPRSLPFQVLMTLRGTALVLALTAIFLWFVLGRVQQQIEQSGRESFRLLAQAAFGELDALTQSHLRYLDTLAKLLPTLADIYSEPGRRALAQTFLDHAGPNALTVTRPDNDQLYFIRQDLNMLPGAAYSTGRLQVQADGSSLITISDRAADHSVLAHRQVSVGLRPTERPWYQGAMRSDRWYVTPPTSIPYTESIGMTLVTHSRDALLALVTPLELIDRLLERVSVSPNGAALLLDDQGRMVSYRLRGVRWPVLHERTARLQPVAALGDPVLTDAMGATARLAENETSLVSLAGQPFLLAWHTMAKVPGTQYRLLLLAPLGDVSQVAESARHDTWGVALAGLAILLPLTWFGTGAMARVLQGLVRNSQRIAQLDFTPSQPPVRSGIREVQALGTAQEAMRDTLATRTRALERVSTHLARLIGIGARLVEEKDRQSLLDAVLGAAREMAGARNAVLFLRDDDDMLRPAATVGLALETIISVLDLSLPHLRRESLAAHTALSGVTSVVDDFDTDPREELGRWRQYDVEMGVQVRTIVSVPLRTPDRRVVGVMQVFNATDPDSGQVVPFSAPHVTYLEALAAQAAVALENQKLIAAQARLLETLVRTLGDAVDAKSGYTGRHCARVPELALMLAQEAHATDSGPLAGFAFRNEDEWHEFRTGAWLHDCGKITSPEHVMDKATKLETVYNRLHEIRTRFEVLLRDARIETLEARLAGHMNTESAAVAYARRADELRDDYAFIATSNLGSEAMAAADVARVRDIASQTWLRHFDDRLGVSYEELQRRRATVQVALPATEALIADRPWHVIERPAELQRALTEGFNMQVPEHLYNHGELYNLCLQRGTLTPEERFKINEHIIHTIRMLESAQFPAHMSRVPEYAGTHHEALDGSGYPRGLKGSELSIPARIMAIADIFEALTAADRPYKQAKTLSESITILHRMKNKGHIDPDLFELFLRTGVHLRYAQRFLAPEQIDVADVSPWLQ